MTDYSSLPDTPDQTRGDVQQELPFKGCRFCGSSRIHSLMDYLSPYFDRWYTLYACDDCGSYLFDPSQHDVDIEQIYQEHRHEPEGAMGKEFRFSRYWKHEVDRIYRLSGNKVSSILDVGCRTGEFLMHWPMDIERCGVEVSTNAARLAMQRGLTVRQGFVEHTDFDQKFDVVTCYAIVEHLSDPKTVLNNLARLVTDEGIIAIMVPTHECLKRKLDYAFGKHWHMFTPPEHLSFLSRSQLDRIMHANGFKPVMRRFTSGGIFNPFAKVPLAGRVFAILMWIADAYIPTNRIPIFDHMYSYYKRI